MLLQPPFVFSSFNLQLPPFSLYLFFIRPPFSLQPFILYLLFIRPSSSLFSFIHPHASLHVHLIFPSLAHHSLVSSGCICLLRFLIMFLQYLSIIFNSPTFGKLFFLRCSCSTYTRLQYCDAPVAPTRVYSTAMLLLHLHASIVLQCSCCTYTRLHMTL